MPKDNKEQKDQEGDGGENHRKQNTRQDFERCQNSASIALWRPFEGRVTVN